MYEHYTKVILPATLNHAGAWGSALTRRWWTARTSLMRPVPPVRRSRGRPRGHSDRTPSSIVWRQIFKMCAGMLPLLTAGDPGPATPHLYAHRFVKNVPCLTLPWPGIAKACCYKSWVMFFTRRPLISLTVEIVWWGARYGLVVTTAVRSPVRPATRWMRVVSRVPPGSPPAGEC
jgi:hypothetical protein